jgi:hypothetical protein
MDWSERKPLSYGRRRYFAFGWGPWGCTNCPKRSWVVPFVLCQCEGCRERPSTLQTLCSRRIADLGENRLRTLREVLLAIRLPHSLKLEVLRQAYRTDEDEDLFDYWIDIEESVSTRSHLRARLIYCGYRNCSQALLDRFLLEFLER